MAAVTVNSFRYEVFGNKRVVTADLTIADTNTWTPGNMHKIDAFFVTSPDKTKTIGGAISGRTITFGASATATDAFAMAIGA